MYPALLRCRASPLLRDLLCFLPAVESQLNLRNAWTGYTVGSDAQNRSYARLQCEEHLLARESGAEYRVGLHFFERPESRIALHDHRYPFAVLPLCLSGARDTLLYLMPWEYRVQHATVESGELEIRSGVPYAIADHTKVFHAVHGVAAHLSVTLADVSGGAARDERLLATKMPAPASEALRLLVKGVLQRYTAQSTAARCEFVRDLPARECAARGGSCACE